MSKNKERQVEGAVGDHGKADIIVAESVPGAAKIAHRVVWSGIDVELPTDIAPDIAAAIFRDLLPGMLWRDRVSGLEDNGERNRRPGWGGCGVKELRKREEKGKINPNYGTGRVTYLASMKSMYGHEGCAPERCWHREYLECGRTKLISWMLAAGWNADIQYERRSQGMDKRSPKGKEERRMEPEACIVERRGGVQSRRLWRTWKQWVDIALAIRKFAES
ncbi:hypothetical protein FB451DRAFT_1180825 [Mycena latifolia]|nr:hypothetical protein FB451DRAFT_1180825 [Mycena latifolia]